MKKRFLPNKEAIPNVVNHPAINRSSLATFWVDEQLVILEHSKEIRSLRGLAGQLRGKIITELFEELIGLEDNLRSIALQKKGQFSLEYINRASVNEEPDYITINAVPVPPDLKGLFLFIEDQNEMGRLLQELAQRRDELILKEAQLQKVNKDLAEANRLKGLMISVASHETGNRLTHIIGQCTSLLEEKTLAETHRESLRRMCQAANHLVMSMNQLIRLDQIERGVLPIDRKSTNANAVLRDTVDLFLLPESSQFEVRTDIPEEGCFIQCNEVHLQQVIFNLLSNAIKYTPPGGQIFVKANNGRFIWSFTVENTGKGIPLDQQEEIFQPYSRIMQTSTDQVPGTGLGLFISRAIVMAYGGRIELSSSPNSKTTFRVDLPAASPSQ